MPQKFLSIKNFEKYQTSCKYPKPWVKLYKSILTDPEFMKLTTHDRFIYMALIILADESGNKILNDPDYLTQRLYIPGTDTVQNTDKPRTNLDLTPLYRSGFLISSNVRRCVQEIELEKSREEVEIEVEKENTSRDVQKPLRAVKGEAISMKAWEAYRSAYHDRYQTFPERNMKVNSLLCRLVADIGVENAPLVAAFYLSHQGRFYVENLHPVSLLLRDGQKLLTEMKTGNIMTAAQARQDDGRVNRGQMWQRLIAKEEAKKETV